MTRREALDKILTILTRLDENDMKRVYEWLRTGWPEEAE